MPGLTWLSRGRGGFALPGSMTFVRGTDVRAVLTGLGVNLDAAMPPAHPEFSSTLGVTVIRTVAFGLSLDEADLNNPLLKVPDQPADPWVGG